MSAIKNKFKIERDYITNKLARSTIKLKQGKPTFLVAHETANPTADAKDHRRYFQNIKFQASAHTFIDDKTILEIIPLEEKAWHVQYKQDKRLLGLGYANDNAVGVELCRTGNFEQAYARYVWYFAYLCQKFELHPTKHIIAHSSLDPKRRRDPQSWLEPNGVSWDDFIANVQNCYLNWDVADQPKKDKPKETNSSYQGHSIVDYLKSIGKDSSKKARLQYAKEYGVKNYNFSAEKNLELLEKMRNESSAAKKKMQIAPIQSDYKGHSIVDFLKSVGIDSSKENRKKLAKKYGIKDYDFSANKNLELLNAMRKGK